jgi:uncharacterized protein with PIN domain
VGIVWKHAIPIKIMPKEGVMGAKRVQKQLNMFRTGKYMVVFVKSKQKKCEECGKRLHGTVHVRNTMGTVATLLFCPDCGTMSLNGNHPVWESIVTGGFYEKVASMCESELR